MNNILIIDDEPVIVDTLFRLLEKTEELDLIIWKAESAIEGLEIMNNHRIDILITDICMPGMSGIELVGHIKNQWSHCKVIFLSGYSDFNYLQSALRYSASDYLLKPINDAILIATIQRVISEIETDEVLQAAMEQSEQQLQQAQFLLHNHFFAGLFANSLSLEKIERDIRQLQIPLRMDQDVLLLMSRVDRWPEDYSLADKILLQNSIDNIVKEYLQQSCLLVTYSEDRYGIWIIQTTELTDERGYCELERLHWFINELLEKIQQSIQRYLKLQVSFVLSEPRVKWQRISGTYQKMSELLLRGIGLDCGILLVDQAIDMLAHYEEPGLSIRDIKKNINDLTNLLEMGDKQQFIQSLARFFEELQKGIFLDFPLQLEVYAQLSAMFLSFMNARNIASTIDRQLKVEMLSNYSLFSNWHAFESFCLQLAELLFQSAESEQKNQKKDIIDKVDAYIIKTFDQNHSLAGIAKKFHLSPSYLSRLYHSEQGVSLFERIKLLKIARAKELLLTEGKKVHEVALELGFYNKSYFAKFFRKNTGMNPQDYKLKHS